MLMALVGVLASVGTLFAILQTGANASPEPADVIIVLGARVYTFGPSLSLKARLDTALELYRQGLAPRLIVSGGQGLDEPTTEAFAMEQYLTAKGVEPEAIYKEEHSYSTVDNLQNSLVLMKELGLATAVIVTSDYHVLRASLIAQGVGLDATAAAAPLPVRPELRATMIAREVLAVWKDLLMLPWYRV